VKSLFRLLFITSIILASKQASSSTSASSPCTCPLATSASTSPENTKHAADAASTNLIPPHFLDVFKATYYTGSVQPIIDWLMADPQKRKNAAVSPGGRTLLQELLMTTYSTHSHTILDTLVGLEPTLGVMPDNYPTLFYAISRIEDGLIYVYRSADKPLHNLRALTRLSFRQGVSLESIEKRANGMIKFASEQLRHPTRRPMQALWISGTFTTLSIDANHAVLDEVAKIRKEMDLAAVHAIPEFLEGTLPPELIRITQQYIATTNSIAPKNNYPKSGKGVYRLPLDGRVTTS